MTKTQKSESTHEVCDEDIAHASDPNGEALNVTKSVCEHVEGNALLVDKQGRVRHLPIPSNNPNDPLNFKPWEKAAIIASCCWFCE
jgi:hypothetical protein